MIRLIVAIAFRDATRPPLAMWNRNSELVGEFTIG
jgi:hypothetical protein